jgi:hypothetical protein
MIDCFVICQVLASQLPPLVATENLDVVKLLQMVVLDLWALFPTKQSEGQKHGSPKHPSVEAAVHDHLEAVLLASILPTYTLKESDDPRNFFALPVAYVLLVWLRYDPEVLDDAFATRPHVWPSLCHLLNALVRAESKFGVESHGEVDVFVLPEEVELRGFAPLDARFASFRRVWEKEAGKMSGKVRENDAKLNIE